VHGQLFTVFTVDEGQIVQLRDFAQRAEAWPRVAGATTNGADGITRCAHAVVHRTADVSQFDRSSRR
jgi:hypothetical protein